MPLNRVITGTGSFIPPKVVENKAFENNPFLNENGSSIETKGQVTVERFREITGISERRYITDDLVTSDIATKAAELAIGDANCDRESIDLIIVAHNFGDVAAENGRVDICPSLAARVKQGLGIENPFCIAYDIIFGCPGWLQALIQADQAIRAGDAKKCLVIGADALSRIVDPFDRDTMIFADGAGAVILEAKNEKNERGIINSAALTHANEEADYLRMGPSNNKFTRSREIYIKMKGRKIYEYALKHVPAAMKYCLSKSNIEIDEVKKVLIHQANEKMDEAIIHRFYRQYKRKVNSQEVMPMTIEKLGNSSVATVPTLLDLLLKEKLTYHSIEENDVLLFASVGAGMSINAMTYRV